MTPPGVAMHQLLALLLSTGPPDPVVEQLRTHLTGAEAADANLACTVHHSHHGPNGAAHQTARVEVRAAGRTRFVAESVPFDLPTGEPNTARRSVFGYNPRYTFGLRGEGDGWALDSLGPPPDMGREEVRYGSSSPYGGFTYRELLDDPGTDIRTQAVDWRGGPAIEVVLETGMPPYPGAPSVRHRLGIFVRPDRPGLVRGFHEYGIVGRPHDQHEYVIDYEAGGEPFPAVKSVEWHSIPIATGPPHLIQRSVVTGFRRLAAPPPEVDFTVSAFGLPEPATVPTVREDYRPAKPEGPPTPAEGPPDDRWHYLAVAGIVAVGVVAFVRAGRRR